MERDRLARLIERAPVAILSASASPGQPIRPNARARKLFGSSVSWRSGSWEHLGKLRKLDGSTLAQEEDPTYRALQGEQINVEEALVVQSGPSGTKVLPVLVNATPIRAHSGKIAGAMTMIEDISTLKELERLREEWSSVIAHDLRQPITAIEMQSQLLKMARDQATIHKLAEHIQTGARQLSRMTADLLDFSRIEAQRLSLEPRSTRLADLISDVVERLGPSLQGRRIRVVADPSLPEVRVDPGRMEQVIGNLISNAAKYGYPNSEILIESRMAGAQAEISVTNRGQGIDPASLERLFQRFQRTRAARESRVPGIGLGLYISKGLVEAHGGVLEAESRPGETTTFRIKLPIAQAEAA